LCGNLLISFSPTAGFGARWAAVNWEDEEGGGSIDSSGIPETWASTPAAGLYIKNSQTTV
jgi:hypothetical protein